MVKTLVGRRRKTLNMGKITLSCELCGETVTHYETFFHEVGGIKFKVNDESHFICDICCEQLGNVIINEIIERLGIKYGKNNTRI